MLTWEHISLSLAPREGVHGQKLADLNNNTSDVETSWLWLYIIYCEKKV